MIKALINVLVVVSLVALIGTPSNGLKYSVCEQTQSLASVTSVKVNDCNNLVDEPCPFVRGFNKSIEIDFVPRQKVDQVKVKAAGKLSTLPVPFVIKPDNACGNYGFDCPLEADKNYKFNLTLPIMRSYPKINVDVFVHLVDDKGRVLACVELPAQIREPQKAGAPN